MSKYDYMTYNDLLGQFKTGREGEDLCPDHLGRGRSENQGLCSPEEKLEQLAGNHGACNVSEFSTWMKVSRQTICNWRNANYLVYSGKKVNLLETLELWKSLPWLSCK